ncbi:MAG: hypothetical protein HY692_00640 [Cyanobacteria bacterium NC_groundwater_1444_Ag_S-0.65um_54_12]|nr:hypothetical protein [Cyanobacteria bacterium NC_groundwater_1444_Ag_S-0.65um_54_12]
MRSVQFDLVQQLFHVQVVYDLPPPLQVHGMRASAFDYEEDLTEPQR